MNFEVILGCIVFAFLTLAGITQCLVAKKKPKDPKNENFEELMRRLKRN